MEWEDEWIELHFAEYRRTLDLYNDYQALFGEVNYNTFRSHIQRVGLYRDLNWSEEQDNWLRQNYPHLGRKRATQEFNKHFAKNKSVQAVKVRALRLGLKTNASVAQHNQSLSQGHPNGALVDDNGYLKIKIQGQTSKWVRYHRYLYEKAHGKLPKGYKIMFLDGNKRNFDLDNMIAVPSAYFALMNKLNLHSEFPDINLTSIKWCDLYMAIKKRGMKLHNGKFIRETLKEVTE